MKKISFAVLLMLAGAALVSATEIAFVDTYDNALKAAAEKKQNVLITFWSDT